MPIDDQSLLTKAAQHFASHELTSDDQTLITLFLQSVKTANSAALSKIVLAKLDWLPFRFLHDQCYREMELISLLAKSTEWSMNPRVYTDATALNLKLLQNTNIMQFALGILPTKELFYEYLALSHAFMAQIRFLPLLPADNPLTTRFLSAVNEVEITNGRLIQTQIRLLKDMESPLSLEDKEQLISKTSAVVSELFADLLRLLCAEETPAIH